MTIKTEQNYKLPCCDCGTPMNDCLPCEHHFCRGCFLKKVYYENLDFKCPCGEKFHLVMDTPREILKQRLRQESKKKIDQLFQDWRERYGLL